MSYKFNPNKCLAVIAAYPDMMVSPQLIAWLHSIGVVNIETHRHGDGRIDCGYNHGVHIALASDFNQFIFSDNDIWPSVASNPFLKAKGDVVSCRYGTLGNESWDEPDSFHAGLWRTNRKSLQAVGIKPFRWVYDELGTHAVECLGAGFARRAKAAGLELAYAGTAVHEPRSQSVPMRMRLSTKG